LFISLLPPIEEGRSESKIKHLAIFFLFSSKKVSADIIQNLSVGNFSPKTERTKTKAARCIFFLMPLPFLYILNSLQSRLTVYLWPSLSAC
jgi:hypothetical protein